LQSGRRQAAPPFFAEASESDGQWIFGGKP
jgi:hypothetical protein